MFTNDQKNLQMIYEGLTSWQKYNDGKPYQVNKEKFYWSYRKEQGKPKIGFSVPTWKVYHEPFQKIEDQLEEIRKRVNPTAPSRNGCIFLSPDADGWGQNEYKCEVEATGKILIADYEIYSRFADMCRGYYGRVDPEEIIEYMEQYWTNGAYSPEIILQGSAIVTGYV
jgi:hypothetical protein